MTTSKNRFDILDGATNAVTEREGTYGSPKANFERAAAFANVILKDKLKADAEITAADWGLLMAIALKGARAVSAPDDANTLEDGAGYYALISEVV